MSLATAVFRKSFKIRYSGRSTDYISPSFIFGCGYQCAYCYMRRHKPKGWNYATNTGDILTAINNHVWTADVLKPNQTHNSLITYDLGCNSDMALHAKHWDWKYVFDYFKHHDLAMGSFATKYVNKDFLEYNPNGKIRIRFSLMPQVYADVLEPNTSSIIDRINAINDFKKAGYDVHINFSPVIYTPHWLSLYKELFELVDSIVENEYKPSVLSEVIFLTHNKGMHEYNLLNKLYDAESLLWIPGLQEYKTSQYGGKNIRYSAKLKSRLIQEFTELHDSIIKWNTIRYIF